jgi:UDP-N-acetylglucosamine--N-acetylmuramyl-(pentapeptide) pyrophosphoryl-undecaprenol N-acetylglucosamine transferase
MALRVIISGGGTGGHIFPAIAIADSLKKIDHSIEILFVGAKGKMEMDKVPASGYRIEGLDIVGIQRKITLKNLLVPFKLLKSLLQSIKIVRTFKPDIGVGVGGYASGPLMQICRLLKIPYVLQEQNSYAGVTNKILGKKAEKIYVAYEGMYKFFNNNKIVLTGNPIRSQIGVVNITKEDACKKFGLDSHKQTVLIFGGSLGAKTLNEAVVENMNVIKEMTNLQIIWQVGKVYYNQYNSNEVAQLFNVKVLPFIEDMATAYAASDIVICRAGALTISELSLIGKPSILVPSPNVAEDHQTHNASALVSAKAAWMVKDVDAKKDLFSKLKVLVNDEREKQNLRTNLLKLGKPQAADVIAQDIINIAKERMN